MIKWGLFQGCKMVQYLQISGINHIKKEHKNNMIISIAAEKTDKI